jgi:hypothetical protein
MTELYRKIHGAALDRSGRFDERVQLAPPHEVTGMGPLLMLEVEHGDDERVEQWHFRKPYPRLCFEGVTPTARGRSQLWILGGAYSLASGRFVAGSAARARALNLAAESARRPQIVERFRKTHGGRNPTEAMRATLDIPSEVVPIGPLYAVTYDADKGDGVYPYRHQFEPEARPMVCTNLAGSQLFLLGGAYTVTAHGIEDSED